VNLNLYNPSVRVNIYYDTINAKLRFRDAVLETDVDVRVRYVFRIFKLRQKPRIWCSLSIPVKAEGLGPAVGGAVASGERCRVKY
jgi:hypothetical protein